MRWSDIEELEKRNTAKIIPNGIGIKLKDGTEVNATHFLTFLVSFYIRKQTSLL